MLASMPAHNNPAIQAELHVLEDLESRGVDHVQPNEKAHVMGRYQFGVTALLDAARVGLSKVPWEVKGLYKAFESSVVPHEMDLLRADAWKWMKKHPETVDQIAEEYYVRYVRPRAGNNPALALMMYHNPSATRQEMEQFGATPDVLNQDFRKTEAYLEQVYSQGPHSERANRARRLLEWTPLLENAGQTAAKRVWAAEQRKAEGVPNAEVEALQGGLPSLPDIITGIKNLVTQPTTKAHKVQE